LRILDCLIQAARSVEDLSKALYLPVRTVSHHLQKLRISGLVSSMMPCRVAVYEDEEGRVIVSHMNADLVSKLFGGNIAAIIADATSETELIAGSALN